MNVRPVSHWLAAILLLAACAMPAPTPTSTAPATIFQPSFTPDIGLATQPPSSPPPSATPAPSPTGAPTPTPPAGASPSADSTLTPTSAGACQILPSGGFLTVWQGNPDLQAALGCPASFHPRIEPAAWDVRTLHQPFERGAMIWSDHIGWYAQPVVYVLFADSTYQRFDDTFDPYTDPGATGETPPPGLIDPTLGFGKVWREQAGVRAALGWATAPEAPGLGKFQLFFHGEMIWVEAAGRTYVFHQGTVHVFDIPFGGE